MRLIRNNVSGIEISQPIDTAHVNDAVLVDIATKNKAWTRKLSVIQREIVASGFRNIVFIHSGCAGNP